MQLRYKRIYVEIEQDSQKKESLNRNTKSKLKESKDSERTVSMYLKINKKQRACQIYLKQSHYT